MDLNLTLNIYFVSIVELLGFYLILANIHGKDLKTAWRQLVNPESRMLANLTLLMLYPLAIAIIVQMIRNHGGQDEGYLIDNIFRPFVIYFLLGAVFSIKKALLTFILSMGIAFIANVFRLLFSLSTPFVFLLTLTAIILMASQNHFERIYNFLAKKRWLLTTVCLISAVIYFLLFLTDRFSIPLPAMLSLLLFWTTMLHLRKEVSLLIEQIKGASSDEFLNVLKGASSDYMRSDTTHWYIIRNNDIVELITPLSKKLELQQMRGAIKDYEYVVTKRQIKISVIL